MQTYLYFEYSFLDVCPKSLFCVVQMRTGQLSKPLEQDVKLEKSFLNHKSFLRLSDCLLLKCRNLWVFWIFLCSKMLMSRSDSSVSPPPSFLKAFIVQHTMIVFCVLLCYQPRPHAGKPPQETTLDTLCGVKLCSLALTIGPGVKIFDKNEYRRRNFEYK